MTRIFTEGFEMGDGEGLTYPGGMVINTSKARSGSYSIRLRAGDAEPYIGLDDLSEIFCRFVVWDWDGIGSDGQFGIIFKNDTTTLIQIRQDSVNSALSIYIGGSKVTTGSAQLMLSNWYLVETHLKLDDSDGIVEVKVNGLLDASFSGDTKPDSNTVFNRLYIDNIGSSGGYVYCDDIAINDTTGDEDNSWCGDGHIILYKPNSTGSATMLMGNDGDQTNNYALVDDIPSDGDTTFVYSGSAGYYDLYGFENTNLPANSRITRLWVESRAKDPEEDYILGVILTESGSYTSGSIQLMTAYSPAKFNEYTTNPSTSAIWLEDEIDNLQAGVMVH